MNYKLTLLQFGASRFIISCFNRKIDGIIIAVCGAGKTEMCFPVISKNMHSAKIAFAIPRIDICLEIYERLRSYFPEKLIGIHTGNQQINTIASVLVLTTNQLLKYKHYFQLIIIDEVDAFPFETDPKYYQGVNNCLTNGSIIYLTSTPSTTLLAKQLDSFFIYKRWHNYPLPVPHLFQLDYQSRPFNFKLYWILKKRKRGLLVFIASIKKGYDFSNRLKKIGITHHFVYSSAPNRSRDIEEFRKGHVPILLTTTILERGITFEDIDVVIVDSDNRFYTTSALVQIAGRACRKINYQKGKVYFCYNRYTAQIDEALKQIKACNKKM